MSAPEGQLTRQTRVRKSVRDGWEQEHRDLQRFLDVTGNSRHWEDRGVYPPGTPEHDLTKQYAEGRRLMDLVRGHPEATDNEIWQMALADYVRRTRGGIPE